jgi:hypothetical protein
MGVRRGARGGSCPPEKSKISKKLHRKYKMNKIT